MIKAKDIKKLFLSSKENKYQTFLKEEQELILKLEEMIKENAESCQTSFCPSSAFFTDDEWDKIDFEYGVDGYKKEIIRYFRSCGFSVEDNGNYYVIFWE
jgi:hypothetical protein